VLALILSRSRPVPIANVVIGGVVITIGMFLVFSTSIPIKSQADYENALRRSDELEGTGGTRAAYERFALRLSRLRYHSKLKALAPGLAVIAIGVVAVFLHH
jgi:dipeptide/tripeptide permease